MKKELISVTDDVRRELFIIRRRESFMNRKAERRMLTFEGNFPTSHAYYDVGVSRSELEYLRDEVQYFESVSDPDSCNLILNIKNCLKLSDNSESIYMIKLISKKLPLYFFATHIE